MNDVEANQGSAIPSSNENQPLVNDPPAPDSPPPAPKKVISYEWLLHAWKLTLYFWIFHIPSTCYLLHVFLRVVCGHRKNCSIICTSSWLHETNYNVWKKFERQFMNHLAWSCPHGSCKSVRGQKAPPGATSCVDDAGNSFRRPYHRWCQSRVEHFWGWMQAIIIAWIRYSPFLKIIW